MGYQIFIPGATGASSDNLRRVGLGDLLAQHDKQPSTTDVLRGPGGQPGQLWGWQTVLSCSKETHRTVASVPNAELKLPAGSFYWVFEKDWEPTPETLQRDQTFSGFEVPLSGGRMWLIPNVMELPQQFGFDDAGELVKRPQKGWRPFVEDAEWALNQCLIDLDSSIVRNWKRELTVACRFLSANYRLNRELIIQLGLITPENVLSVMLRGVDRDRIKELAESLKKSTAGALTPAGSGVSDG